MPAKKTPSYHPTPEFDQMTRDELLQFVDQCLSALSKKQQREANYLARRAHRGVYTPTDEAYEQDQQLETDLLAFLTHFRTTLMKT